MNRDHRTLDARSRAMHALVAQKIRADPDLLLQASALLERWIVMGDVRSRPALLEWRRLIGEGLDACLAFAVEESDLADQLRQSSPLPCLLSHPERFAFLQSWDPGMTMLDEEFVERAVYL